MCHKAHVWQTLHTEPACSGVTFHATIVNWSHQTLRQAQIAAHFHMKIHRLMASFLIHLTCTLPEELHTKAIRILRPIIVTMGERLQVVKNTMKPYWTFIFKPARKLGVY
ncbi:hypothetical protein ASD07_14210 [Duganella sp. Root336D2]|nr:hypothetical protein ASD07_14210 [Duganella sp. Root336D2]